MTQVLYSQKQLVQNDFHGERYTFYDAIPPYSYVILSNVLSQIQMHEMIPQKSFISPTSSADRFHIGPRV